MAYACKKCNDFFASDAELVRRHERFCEVESVNNIQHGGDHYKSKAIQPWDYIISNNLGYLEGNVVKYVSRYKDKGGIEDLKKARHYLDKLIEVTEATAVPTTASEE